MGPLVRRRRSDSAKGRVLRRGGARGGAIHAIIRIHTETEGDFEAGKRSEAILGNEPAQWRPTLLPAGCIVRG